MVTLSIASAEVYRYARAATPEAARRGIPAVRQGLLLRLATPDGTVGCGEAAPLHGFSTESLDQAAGEVLGWAEWVRGRQVPAVQFAGPLREGRIPEPRWRGVFPMPPSAQFCIDAALLHLAGRAMGLSPARLLTATPRETVRVNGLVTDGPPADAARHAHALCEAGFRCVKLKVGRRPPEDDRVRVEAVRTAIGPDVQLRLDANRAWTEAEAASLADLMRVCDVAYVEEPLAEPARLAAFARDTGMPVALDETVVAAVRAVPGPATAEALLAGPWGHALGVARALVVKPTLTGGLDVFAALVQTARLTGADLVLSSAFEGGVAVAMLAAWAAACDTDAPAGLDTLSGYADDLLRTPLTIRQGALNVGNASELAADPAWDRLRRF